MKRQKETLPVDTGWAWVIAFGYFISIFCMVGIAKSFGILLEEFEKYFNIPVAMAALVMGVAGGMYTLAAPVCIAAGQHFTQRKVVMLGGLIGGLGLSLSGFLFSIEWVILTFGAMYGFGNACLFGNGLVMLGQYFNKRRSLANGLALSGASLGQFTLPPLLQYLLDKYSLSGTLIIIGGMYLNVIMCGLLFRPTSFYTDRTHPEPHPDAEKLLDDVAVDDKGDAKISVNNHAAGVDHDTCRTEQELAANGAGDMMDSKSSAKNQLLDSVRYRTTSTGSVVVGSVDNLHCMAIDAGNQDNLPSGKIQSTSQADDDVKTAKGNKCLQFLTGLIDFRVLKNFVVVLIVLMSFLIFFGHFNFILFMPSSASTRGVSKYDKAFLVSITGICDLCGRILIGILGDLHIIARYKLLATATFLCGLAILCFNFAWEYWLMGVCVGFYGFFGGCYVAINAPVLIDMVGLKSMPKVLGVVLFIQGLGAAIGQPLLGAIRDEVGSFEAVNFICSFSMICGSLVLFSYPLVKRYEEKNKPIAADSELVHELEI